MIEIDNAKYKEILSVRKFARQADSSILYRVKDATLLATVTLGDIKEEDFLPLNVQYLERAYASGKIPSGFIKREKKPSDFEILTSRLIDRSLRPLFPKNYRREVQVTILVLSFDYTLDIASLAVNAAAATLYISSAPVRKMVSAFRVAYLGGNFILQPTIKEMESSSIDLLAAGTKEDISMIEFLALKECVEEKRVIEALNLAREHIKQRARLYEEALLPFSFEKEEMGENLADKNSSIIDDYILKHHKEELIEALNYQVGANLRGGGGVRDEELAETINLISVTPEEKLAAVKRFKRSFMRNKILNEGLRLDGRELDEIRNINIESNILASVHGSAIFDRGETQVLSVCTLGGENDAQMIEGLGDKSATREKFMLHYNFPSFCTGENRPIGFPSRRELGHGNLAKRALLSSLASDTPECIRMVSEVLGSDGSSSMASVCSASLALFGAGVKPRFLVAGIAMGLIKEGEKYAILSDISGLEDANGDLDFKIAGNREGITALQMDIKIPHLDSFILEQILSKGRMGLSSILEKMEEAQRAIVVNEDVLPTVISFQVIPATIPLIIGHGGKTIHGIIEKFGVKINISKESGVIEVVSQGLEGAIAARDFIKSISGGHQNIDGLKVGDAFTGKVKRVTDFGIFINFRAGCDGLIKKFSVMKVNKYLNDFKEGEEVEVKIIGINPDNKIELDFI